MNKVNITEPPELIIILKSILIGVLLAISVKLGIAAGNSLNSLTSGINECFLVFIALTLFCGLAYYAKRRGALRLTVLLFTSKRLDLFIFLLFGITMEHMIGNWMFPMYEKIELANPIWILILLGIVLTAMGSVIIRKDITPSNNEQQNMSFALDEEITQSEQDLLGISEHAKYFADSVIENGSVAGLVYGVDGPWGVGKSSFINLAQRAWSEHDDLIVCRFEPLRYANEQDLTERLIREVTAEIQKSVFAPEFEPVANRYSRVIKGKADFSLFGIKISLQPGSETVEDLITDIDAVLKRVDRRLIIVIDDLDRLDHKTISNVLFSTRRTFKLSQATYVLSYDTELLVGDDTNIASSREFLEKFVSVKISLFVDTSSLCEFLKGGWQTETQQLAFVPPDTLDQLASLLNELADVLVSDLAPKYLPMVGNLRKVKRIINAMVAMQIETSSLNKTDFNKLDLLNLILLHLNYPGVFRRIYSEEGANQYGIFSVKVDSYKSGTFNNHKDFKEYINGISEKDLSAKFLLEVLFDVERLQLASPGNVEQEVQSSRACFNSQNHRNLENFLKLIVRFVKPEPKDTYVLYKAAFDKIKGGKSVVEILSSSEFKTEETHDKFWRIVTNNCYDLDKQQADNVISYLIENLDDYASVSTKDRSMRIRSIYTLTRLLDRVGWIKQDDNKRHNSPENTEEIAWRIFGELQYTGKGLIEILTDPSRGVLGWFDLILFRLTCCSDRSAQLFEISKALIYNQDKNAKYTGPVDKLTILEMRKLSQNIARKFIETFVKTGLNYYQMVDQLSFDDLRGTLLTIPKDQELTDAVNKEKTLIASFVMYQLANIKEPSGSGIGFGYYDLEGEEDKRGIASIINDYVFDVCFSPKIDKSNVVYFLNHCLSHLSNSFFSYDGDDGDDGYIPTKNEIAGGFDKQSFVNYWTKYKDVIKEVARQHQDKNVFTSNYTVTYKDHLDPVFELLDELESELTQVNKQP